MTRVKTTDDDDEPLAGADELSVHYRLGDSEPFHGMLPLAGIVDASELLTELAEFGCELQDDIIVGVNMMQAEYEDAAGKTKVIGPRTPLSEVVEAGEVTVLTKTAAQQQRSTPARIINGSGGVPRTWDDDLDLDDIPHANAGGARGAVAVKVAPRPVGARAFP